jgi:hypothetical protein
MYVARLATNARPPTLGAGVGRAKILVEASRLLVQAKDPKVKAPITGYASAPADDFENQSSPDPFTVPLRMGVDVVEEAPPDRILARIGAGETQNLAALFRDDHELVVGRIRQSLRPDGSAIVEDGTVEVIVLEHPAIGRPPAVGVQQRDPLYVAPICLTKSR